MTNKLSKKWELSLCDSHAECELWYPSDAEGNMEANWRRVEIQSNTGSADVRLIGRLVQAHLNGETDIGNLVQEIADLRRVIINVKHELKS